MALCRSVCSDQVEIRLDGDGIVHMPGQPRYTDSNRGKEDDRHFLHVRVTGCAGKFVEGIESEIEFTATRRLSTNLSCRGMPAPHCTLPLAQGQVCHSPGTSDL